MPDIISVLKKDHEKVKGLFDQFESVKEKEPSRRDAIIQEAIRELEAHSEIEEKLVYPLIQQEEEIFNEALEEHHVVDLLIGELKKMKSSADGRLVAKFEVLAENVRHHIKEEESQVFPKLKKADADLDEIGDEAESMKMELMGHAQRTSASAGRGAGRADPGSDGKGVRLEDDDEEEEEDEDEEDEEAEGEEEEEEEEEDEGDSPSAESSRGSTRGRSGTKSSQKSAAGSSSRRAPARSSASRSAGRSSGRSSPSRGGSASTTARSGGGSSGGSPSRKSSATSGRSTKGTTKRKSSSSR